MAELVCRRCGAEVPAAASFCPACAEPIATPPPTPGPPQLPTAKTPNRNLVYGVVAGLLAAALVAGALVVTRDPGGIAPGEVFLEPAGFQGRDPFTENVDTSTTPPPARLVSTAPPTPTPTGRVGVRSVQGAAPGLYGGTGNEAACDATRLVAFLEAEPEKAAAWAAVQGITPEAIAGFVATLTPVVLRADTRVTNHGYRDGRATPLQSVLEAGTAVLVDDLGIPRVKCGCGNPLAPPETQPGGVRYTGTRWPGFRPEGVLVVVNTVRVRVTTFVLVDLARPGFFTRPAGVPPAGTPPADGPVLIDTFCDLFPADCRPPSLVPERAQATRPGEPALGTGDVQVTLRWSSTADLDLAVTDPGGERVDFQVPTSSSGGRLDVDSNAGCANPTTTPVENVFWPAGGSPEGEYTITVRYYRECPGGSGPQSFELTVLMGGAPVAVRPVGGPGEPTFRLLGGEQMVLAQTGTLEPGGEYVATAVKGAGTGLVQGVPPGPPHSVHAQPVGPEADVVPGRITISWLWAFDDTATEGYELTVEPGGETFVLPGTMTELTLPGLEPGAEYTFTLVAFNEHGNSPPVVVTGTTGPAEPEAEAAPEPPAPQPETLEEFCDRTYPPPPSVPAENPQWTLCMHDPTSADAIPEGQIPLNVPPPGV